MIYSFIQRCRPRKCFDFSFKPSIVFERSKLQTLEKFGWFNFWRWPVPPFCGKRRNNFRKKCYCASEYSFDLATPVIARIFLPHSFFSGDKTYKCKDDSEEFPLSEVRYWIVCDQLPGNFYISYLLVNVFFFLNLNFGSASLSGVHNVGYIYFHW